MTTPCHAGFALVLLVVAAGGCALARRPAPPLAAADLVQRVLPSVVELVYERDRTPVRFASGVVVAAHAEGKSGAAWSLVVTSGHAVVGRAVERAQLLARYHAAAARAAGARGRSARLLRLAVRGPLGRLLRGLGCVRAPHLWSVVCGDLHWVGVSPPRPGAHGGLGAGRAVAPPGLVTLAALAPAPLRGQDRVALDRLYAATRSRRGDLRLLAEAVRHRLRAPADPVLRPARRLLRMRQ